MMMMMMSEKRRRAVEELKAEHTPAAIRERLEVGPSHSYLRDFIYGAIDGAVTTFAVVCGVAGANLSGAIIIILGVANLLADGFSMAVSNYLGTRAEQQVRDRARQIEYRHVELIPEGEREEIRQIFARKGFEGEDLERAVEIITSDAEQWVDTMLREELGLKIEDASASKAGWTTFIAFVIIGAIPLLPYIYGAVFGTSLDRSFVAAIALTGIAFFIVGAVKGKMVNRSWRLSGLETLAMGGCAAVIAYVIGALLQGLA